MKVLRSTWFTPMGGACIGVVMAETLYDGIIFYIGLCAGVNQSNDEKLILERGASFPYKAGMKLFGMEDNK